MSQKIIKTGNSAALTIPSKIMRALDLSVGDKAKTTFNQIEGSITYRFPDVRQLRLKRLGQNQNKEVPK
jgi:antitoxin component of MazEF toxin-antitoxin module